MHKFIERNNELLSIGAAFNGNPDSYDYPIKTYEYDLLIQYDHTSAAVQLKAYPEE